MSEAKAIHRPTAKCGVSGWHPCPVYTMPVRKPLKKTALSWDKRVGKLRRNKEERKPIPKRRAKPRRNVVAKTDRKFRAWLREQWPCCIPLNEETSLSYFPTSAAGGKIDLAHVKSRGAGGGDMGNLLPLCHGHHMEQHSMGVKSFEAKYGVDLKALALRYAEQFAGLVRSPEPKKE